LFYSKFCLKRLAGVKFGKSFFLSVGNVIFASSHLYMPQQTLTFTDVLLLYRHLQQIRTQLDGEGIVCPKVFETIHRDLQRLQPLQNETPPPLILENQCRQINQLILYLEQFGHFKTLVTAFFNAYPAAQDDNFEDTVHYNTILKMSRRVFADFQAGNYLQSLLQPSLEDLNKLIRKYAHSVDIQKSTARQLIERVPFEQLPIFSPVQKNGYTGLQNYMQCYFQTTPTILYSVENFNLIAQGYLTLKAEALKDSMLKKNNPFSAFLPALKDALKEKDHPQISAVLAEMSILVLPTQITQPENNTTTHFKVINIIGTAPPNSQITLLLNETTQLTTLSNASGQFTFEQVELHAGPNTLTCFNTKLRFLYSNIPQHHLYFTAKFPFAGRIDPVTQQPLHPDEIDIIWRCEKCRNYMFSYSVSDNDGICAILKCNSKKFYTKAQKEFWTE
jgi:hypothetical protein